MSLPARDPLSTQEAAMRRYRNALAAGVPGPGPAELQELLAATLQLYEAHGRPLGAKGLAVWLDHRTWTTRN